MAELKGQGRTIVLTAEERDLLATLPSTREVQISRWEKYGKRRLYIRIGGPKNEAWMDLNDPADLQMTFYDFGSGDALVALLSQHSQHSQDSQDSPAQAEAKSISYEIIADDGGDSLRSPAIPDTSAYAMRVPVEGDASGWQQGYPRRTKEQIDAIWAGEPYRLSDFDMERLADAYELYGAFSGEENDPLVAAMLSRGYATQNPAYEAEIAENGKRIAALVARFGSGYYTVGVGLLARRWALTDKGREFVRGLYR